jgi:signal transduction histidine kinase
LKYHVNNKISRGGAITLSARQTIDLQECELDRLRKEVQVLQRRVCQNQRLSSVGTMTAMVVHEFNNILTPIMNYAQLAKNDRRYVSKSLDVTIDGGARAAEICRAILGFSKEATGEGECFTVRDVVNDSLKTMIGDRKHDGIEFSCDIPADIKVVGVKVELQQVIMNLLINARAAVLEIDNIIKSQRRKIEITAQVKSKRVILRVSDNGIGIPPANLGKIFEPFFTTKTEQSDGLGGSGLGLSICYEIMQSMNGKISVESTPGHGTSFSLDLPVAA